LQGQRLTVPDLVAPRVFQTEMLSALDTGCGAYQLRTEGRAGP
jgi:hypothetical protein